MPVIQLAVDSLMLITKSTYNPYLICIIHVNLYNRNIFIDTMT